MFSKIKSYNLNTVKTVAIITLVLTATLNTAQAEQGRKGQHKGKPPQEAFTACADQIEAGNFCSFETAEGNIIEGTCKTPRREGASLVCKPNRDSKRQRQK